MATIAELKVKIGANVTDFDKKLSGIQNKMKETGKRMQSMGKTMSMAVTAPLAGMAAMALKSFDTQVKAENKLRAALIANGQEVEATIKSLEQVLQCSAVQCSAVVAPRPLGRDGEAGPAGHLPDQDPAAPPPARGRVLP